MWRIATALFLLCRSASACDAGVSWGTKGGTGWPTGADATSYSHTLTWEKMDPPEAGNVFVSLTLSEGCGAGYIGAQMHGGTDQMFTDWAIWDAENYNNTRPWDPANKNCVRYDGEGHGTQCGVLAGHKWEMNTPYIFNVSLVFGNESGAHFKSTITNGRTKEVIPLGEIWTGKTSASENCSRLLVGGGGFQEIYSGGNFTSVASVEGPIFRGVPGHPADVMPTNFSDCFLHNSCYGKGKAANCRNETVHHCLPPACPIPKETFLSGQVPLPDAVIPPWDHNPDVNESTDCWFGELTGLDGGVQPAYWGQVLMKDSISSEDQRKSCCGFCNADPECKGAQLYGDRCSLRHITNTSANFTFVKGVAVTTAILPNGRYPPPSHASEVAAYV